MMTSWAWLVALVAMVTASRLVWAVHYYSDGAGSDPSQQSEQKAAECPSVCRCQWKQFKAQTGLDERLYSVDCNGQGLLEFPKDLTNMTQMLDMKDNKLQNLTDLPRLPNLRVLDISRNWLTHLDNNWLFEHVQGLRALSLGDNALTEIQHGSFTGLSQLRMLDLHKNAIRRVAVHAFMGLDNLLTLRLSQNQLFRVQREWFLPLGSLTTLYLDHNLLTDLADNVMDPLTRLQHFDLSHNSLRILRREAMSALERLKFLNLSGNTRLQEVPGTSLNFLPSLDILLMDETGVDRLPSLAFSWLQVAEMSLSYLPKLRVVESAAFYNLTMLRTLQLHDNPNLVYLHPHAFLGLPKLKHLLLHNNGLVAVPGQLVTSLPALSDLHLHHNPLQCDCNIYWLRIELGQVPQHHRTTTAAPTSSHASSSSLVSLDNMTTTTNNGSTYSSIAPSAPPTTASITKTLISEPDRVACFFPSLKAGGGNNIPLLQLGLQYFPPTCPPSSLPLFPGHINVTLGSELWLECQGLGVPQPRISWILPGGVEVNGSTPIDPHDIPITLSAGLGVGHQVPSKPNPTVRHEAGSGGSRIKSSAQIVEETLLYIPSVSLADAGRYGCRAASELGQSFSSTLVHVQNQPLELMEVEVSGDYITVAWKGSIPRSQIKDFQLYYRALPPIITTDVQLLDEQTVNFKNSAYGTKTSVPYTYHNNREDINFPKEGKQEVSSSEPLKVDYKIISLHGSFHRCIISGLQANTRYEVCLVYKRHLTVECQTYTTAREVSVVATASGGITRISGTQIGIGVGSGLATVLVLALLLTLLSRRLRRRKGYLDPLAEEEKSGIPLEGLVTPVTAPSTPLTSSRVALLTNSNI